MVQATNEPFPIRWRPCDGVARSLVYGRRNPTPLDLSERQIAKLYMMLSVIDGYFMVLKCMYCRGAVTLSIAPKRYTFEGGLISHDVDPEGFQNILDEMELAAIAIVEEFWDVPFTKEPIQFRFWQSLSFKPITTLPSR